jgi:hypothetical protein
MTKEDNEKLDEISKEMSGLIAAYGKLVEDTNPDHMPDRITEHGRISKRMQALADQIESILKKYR